MTLIQLSYIVAVAQEKNFLRAAKRCFVTQPTLSMQVQKLEEELGVVIFDRSKKPVEATPVGLRIVEQARTILTEERRIGEIVSADKGEVRGTLRLAIIPTLAPYLIPLFLEPFFRKYPAVELVIEESQTENILRSLHEDKIDVGLLVTPLGVPGILEDPLFEESFLAYFSEGHKLLAQERIGERDLGQNDVWLLGEGHCFRDQAMALCKARSTGSQKEKPLTLASGSLETLRRLVDSYQGATLLPEIATLSLDSAEKKRLRRFEEPVPMREVSLAYSRTLLKQPLIQALANVIRVVVPKELTRPPKKRHLVKLRQYG